MRAGAARAAVPPILHFRNPAPAIDWSGCRCACVDRLEPWPRRHGPATTGTSSFGFGGTNAHAILREAPAHDAPADAPGHVPAILTISARSEEALRELVEAYVRLLETNGPSFAAMAYTSNVGRAQLPHRIAVVAESAGEAIAKLRQSRSAAVSAADAAASPPPLSARDVAEQMATSWLHGANLDWDAVHGGRKYRRVPLPSYPFQRRRFWVDGTLRSQRRAGHPLLGARVPSPLRDVIAFEKDLGETPQWLSEHPAAAIVEILAAAARTRGEECALVDVMIERPISTSARELQTILRDDAIEIHSSSGDDTWQRHVRGRIAPRAASSHENLSSLRARLLESVDPAALYADLEERGITLGEPFRRLVSVHRGDGEALACMRGAGAESGDLTPAVLDGAFQLLAALAPRDGRCSVAAGWRSAWIEPPDGEMVWCHARALGSGSFDLHLFSGERSIGAIEGLRLRSVAAARPIDDCLREIVWSSVESHFARSVSGAWSVLAESGADEVAHELARAGAAVEVVQNVDAAVARLQSRNASIVYLAGANATAAEHCIAAVRLAQAVVQANDAARLVIVTRGAQSIGGESIAAQGASALWGVARTFALEHPERRFAILDAAGEGWSAAVVPAIAGGEAALAWRAGLFYVPRVEPLVRDDAPVRLTAGDGVTVESLGVEPLHRRAPGPGEVEIEVDAAALNFIDVLDVLGLLPFARTEGLGCECAGTVVACGANVSHLRIGDRVMAIVPGAFASYVTADARTVVRYPDALTAQDAATLPVNYATASLALFEVAGLKHDERVLIHSAASGTGMAAAMLALAAGAEVHATASRAKWDTLRAMGIEKISDSRSTQFVDDVMRATEGRGVDVVFSANPEITEANLSILAPGGRYLEIGKRGVRSSDDIAAVRPDVAYHVVDIRRLLTDDPQRLGAMLGDVAAAAERGEIRPLPRQSWPLRDARGAFRTMRDGRHIGKIVLTTGTATGLVVRADRSYLVTGGTRGRGLSAARALVARGARNVVLVARHPAGADAQPAIDEMRAAGARVLICSADVSKRPDVEAVLKQIDSELPPLAGVIHAASVRDDDLTRVLAPKVDGALVLHELTRGTELDFFVLYSNAAATLGDAAAETFLDALAHARRASGLPATSIAWGPSLTAEESMAILESTAMGDRPHVCAGRIETVAPERQPAAPPPVAQESSWQSLVVAAPAHERRTILERAIRQEVAAVLGIDDASTISSRRGFFDLGMDSLTSMELRNRLQRRLGCSLPTTFTFDLPTVADVATFAAREAFGVSLDTAGEVDIAALLEAELDELAGDGYADARRA